MRSKCKILFSLSTYRMSQDIIDLICGRWDLIFDLNVDMWSMKISDLDVRFDSRFAYH